MYLDTQYSFPQGSRYVLRFRDFPYNPMTWGWDVSTINPTRNREGSGFLGNSIWDDGSWWWFWWLKDQMIKDTIIQYICIGMSAKYIYFFKLKSYKKYCSYQSYDTCLYNVWFIHTYIYVLKFMCFSRIICGFCFDSGWLLWKQWNNDRLKNPTRFSKLRKQKQSPK